MCVCVALLGGCGGARPELRTSFVEFTPAQQKEIDRTGTSEYRIQEGDILKIAFAYERDLTQDGVAVLSDGSINLIGVDRVEVEGLSITEADSILTAAYSKEYRDPDLSVLVQETKGRQVYVLGEVRDPGIHSIPRGHFDIMSAIGMAGGFGSDAARNGVLVVRVTPDGYGVTELNLEDFGNVEQANLATVGLNSMDVVYVPRSRVGDFSYFAKTVLAGIVSITRIAADVKYISNGGFVRF